MARWQHRVAWTIWEAFIDAMARVFELVTVVEEAH